MLVWLMPGLPDLMRCRPRLILALENFLPSSRHDRFWISLTKRSRWFSGAVIIIRNSSPLIRLNFTYVLLHPLSSIAAYTAMFWADCIIIPLKLSFIDNILSATPDKSRSYEISTTSVPTTTPAKTFNLDRSQPRLRLQLRCTGHDRRRVFSAPCER